MDEQPPIGNLRAITDMLLEMTPGLDEVHIKRHSDRWSLEMVIDSETFITEELEAFALGDACFNGHVWLKKTHEDIIKHMND